ncbi:FGGY-family carbohydrate kinase [Massilia cavernae]|uniref:L-fuculose kinase n=1 Tax=Massilia cavernae TaxID=2320864 RepID=A0A418Y536_9BURK|nr:FGGY family carbohydrate kinase [Massilia cavernae]RJG21287.1 L-fuculose kinase [Massilia cavernae]
MIERTATIVLDIGKTNAKLNLLDADGSTLAERRCANTIIETGRYPHHDTERLWEWMLATFRQFGSMAKVGAIVPVTHGATAALVDHQGLVLPILDYESELPEQINETYARVRPSYCVTYSPDLPAGLNLGRQLAWLASRFPVEFTKARHILMYPQYWAWRLSGVAASEVTSLGCHTDLWDTSAQKYTDLVARKGWQAKFPPIQAASQVLGTLLPELAQLTGLPADCNIICGIHDSNASLLRYLGGDIGTVLSSGTWLIAASFNTPLAQLEERSDMLANTSALGQPIACMRFMGGREFEELAGPHPQVCQVADIQYIIDEGILALPCFAPSGGPFSGQDGSVVGTPPRTAEEWYALATLYCALMSDYCLDKLQATGRVAVEGSFTGNPHFAPLLAALRSDQQVIVSDDASGTTIGGWILHRGATDQPSGQCNVSALQVAGLFNYRQRWRSAVT